MRKGVFIPGLALVVTVSAAAATNEYYTRPEAKAFIDKVIEAHGGKANLDKIERVKRVAELVQNGEKRKVSIYQTRTKIKRVISGKQNVVEIIDGANATAIVQGRNVSEKMPEKSKESLARMLSKPLGYSLSSVDFLGKDSDLRYVGQTNIQGRLFEALESRSATETNLHCVDPATFRIARQISHDKDGISVQNLLAYKTFQGVQVPSKISAIDANGTKKRELDLLIVSDNFDDSEFAKVKETPGCPLMCQYSQARIICAQNENFRRGPCALHGLRYCFLVFQGEANN